MTKRKDKIKISFIGGNADDVTGSCTLVETPKHKILLECGLIQSNNIKDDYESNTRKFKFKPNEIDYCFFGHQHIDHVGLSGRLIKEGFKGKFIATEKSAKFIEPLLLDSAYIMSKDAIELEKRYKKPFEAIYTEDDVYGVVNNLWEYDMGKIYHLDDEISFIFTPNQHIIGSASLTLYITIGNSTKKITYSSDIGNIQFQKPFVEDFEKITKTGIFIGECTYGDKSRDVKKKDRDKDLEKLRACIYETCYDKKGKFIIPSFSMDRSQTLLYMLYEIFRRDKNFDIPIIIDSPLTQRLTQVYLECLDEPDKLILEEIINWKNVKFIVDSNDSKACVEDTKPKIVISASGFATSGRIRHHIKNAIQDSKNTICFVGFSSEGSLASKLKNGKEQKTITIDGKAYRNKCNVLELHSFSSHIQHDDMLAYYSQIQCEAIYLVHSNMDAKLAFSKELKAKLEKENKSTRVVCVNRGTSVSL